MLTAQRPVVSRTAGSVLSSSSPVATQVPPNAATGTADGSGMGAE